MFICGKCKTASESKVSPVVAVLDTRKVDYVNEFDREDEDGKVHHVKVESEGWEIAHEVKVCPTCAKDFGVIVPVPREKAPVKKFEETLAAPLHAPLVGVAAYNATDRVVAGFPQQEGQRVNKRAKRDAEAAVPLIKHFADEHKDFLF